MPTSATRRSTLSSVNVSPCLTSFVMASRSRASISARRSVRSALVRRVVDGIGSSYAAPLRTRWRAVAPAMKGRVEQPVERSLRQPGEGLELESIDESHVTGPQIVYAQARAVAVLVHRQSDGGELAHH